MIRWEAITGFDWDAGNWIKNRAAHGVECADAEQVFLNRPLLLLPDAKHSADEPRLRVLGRTEAGRLLHIAFTQRGTLIRIISARDMNRKERTAYENA